MAKKAPTSIIPSRPMFTTPDRSEKIPPIAANASGVAKRRVAAISPAVKIPSSVSRSTPCIQIPAPAPRSATAIAHSPSLRSPRASAAIARAKARKPNASGTPMLRAVNGGRVTRNASRPSPMPATAAPCPGVEAARRVPNRRLRRRSRLRLLRLRAEADQLAARAPDREDEELRADEEDDERLDHASRGSSRARGRRCWDRAAATTFPPGARRRGATRGRCRSACCDRAGRPRCR